MATDPRTLLYKTADPAGETARAQRLAEQYGFDFVNLEHFVVDHELFRNIPLELMIRYQFLPEKRENGHIAVVVGDPTDVLKLDELELLLGAPLKVRVASPAAIRDKLQKSESTQRVLDEATEGFRMTLVGEDEEGEETLTIDSITAQESWTQRDGAPRCAQPTISTAEVLEWYRVRWRHVVTVLMATEC